MSGIQKFRDCVGRIDLHLHTTNSDGDNTPDEVIRLAAQEELRVIPLTDHNKFSFAEPVTVDVVCVIRQNAMAYIESAVDYLKELPEDDSNLLYLLNQSLIAMQEAVWGHGVKVTKDGPEEILYIRDRARKYLGETRGYG